MSCSTRDLAINAAAVLVARTGDNAPAPGPSDPQGSHRNLPPFPAGATAEVRARAEAGDVAGVCVLMRNMWLAAGDVAAAVSWARHGAHSGDAAAAGCFAAHLLEGIGHESSRALEMACCVMWATRAADAGDALGLVVLAACKLYGLGGEVPSQAEALDLALRAKDLGEIRAFEIIGQCLEIGDGTHHNYTEAIVHYSEGRRRGCPRATYRLGVVHQKGLGVPKNKDEYAGFVLEAAAQGFARAETAAAELLKKTDPARAYALLQSAAQKGYSDAWYRLGKLAEARHDFSDARRCYAEGAKREHKLAKAALHNLSDMIGCVLS